LSEAYQPDTASDYVRLQVRDTGVGIPPDALPKVFQRFYRVEQTAGRSHEGTGIGLALVSELVKLHGGSVGAESELGKGSSFYVEIPFGQQSPMVTQPEPEKQEEEALEDMKYERSAEWWLSNLELERVSEDEKPEEAASPLASSSHLVPRIGLVKDEQGAHSKAWILLVEDNSDMRSYVTRLLKERFRVMEAANGRQALTMMDKHKDKIELVLSDVMMPHLDGFALLRHLRSHKDTETLPVVLLSARAGEEARVEGLAAGADAYLVKPFSATELLTVVDSTLRLARMRLQAAQKEQELRVEADAAKAQMEATLASIRDAFASVDNDLRFTFANDTAMKLLCGANADELRKYVIGQPVESWIPDSRDCRQLRRHIRRAISKGEEIHFESWMETLGCWLEHRIYPGAHGGASVLSKDITARKKAQERLAILAKAGELLAGSVEVEQILTNMVSLPVGGFARGCIIDAFLGNEGKMRRLMSANAQAASWLPDRDEEKRTFGEDWRLSETVQMRGEEVRFMTCLPPDSYVALPLTARGVTFGVWLFVLRENTEDDLTVARELARLTSQSVDNIRLLIETEKANRAKDHFLAALSHELRTPLTPVLLAAEGLAEEECLSLEVRNLVKLIRESIGLEVQLIDDLLDLTKVCNQEWIDINQANYLMFRFLVANFSCTLVPWTCTNC
jgi:signal transduction histidine kinase/DNA-binding response OmpR family regulator